MKNAAQKLSGAVSNEAGKNLLEADMQERTAKEALMAARHEVARAMRAAHPEQYTDDAEDVRKAVALMVEAVTAWTEQPTPKNTKASLMGVSAAMLAVYFTHHPIDKEEALHLLSMVLWPVVSDKKVRIDVAAVVEHFRAVVAA